MNSRAETVLEGLDVLYPEAHCELHYRSIYELAVAVVLSAQTTDASVNRATPALFAAYPDIHALAEAEVSEIEPYLHSLGLYRNKARAVHGLAVMCVTEFGGEIPSGRSELMRLPGVGRKVANVILAEGYGIPAMPVDTHVERVSKRLGLAKPDDTVNEVEEKLKRKFPRERWIKAHHQLIFFGRYLCRARGPLCDQCPFGTLCRYPDKQIKE
ncbi:MAG: endonuclease III [Solobacterium sp.]|nr:endonuclease III [Solobacterium sp.]